MLDADPSLSDEQRRYIYDDPSGLGKGLLSALEWGASVDLNPPDVLRGHVGWLDMLVSKGLWRYDARHDDIWVHSKATGDSGDVGDCDTFNTRQL